ncbi:glycosyltransferase family 2 protein [Patescibacteria group bacterium]|nr:glycosyltransferase family 2 protein [Patescibacteria group bacterium]
MDLSVLIVNWNTKDILKKCLQSIYQYTEGLEFEVIVFDNGSEDGSQDMIEKEFAQVKLIKNSSNDGFVIGNLEAYKQSSGDFILMLNSDAELSENSFKKMLDFMKKDKQIGIVGPRLLNTNGSLQPSCRRFPDLSSQLLILLKVHNLAPKWGAIGRYYMADFDYSKTTEVDQVMGAALLTRRRIIKKIGFLDSYFWAWFEEVDFCKRVKDNGYKNFYYSGTEIYHHKGQSFKNLAKRQRVFNRSMIYYFKKHKPAWQHLVIIGFWPLSMLFSYVVAVIIKLFPIKKSKDL